MIVREPEPLDFSYIPPILHFREKELRMINEIIVEPLRSGICSNMIIFGDSGTGKTASIKSLMRDTKGPLIIYENALSFGSLKLLLIDVIQKLGKIIPGRGLTYKQIFKTIKNLLDNRDKRVILVIDEASNIMRTDTDGFYNLFRSHELYSAYISTIAIAIENPIIYMGERDRKSLGVFSSMRFPKYSGKELYRIIGDRSEKALMMGSYSPDILSYISEIAEQFGSARVAIELLQKSAYIAEYRRSDVIESEDVRAAKSLINPYITESKLAELDKDELLVLLAICRCLYDENTTQIPCISQEVGVLSEQLRIGEFDTFKIYKIIKKLEVVGFVDSKIEGRGARQGVGKIVGISDVPVKILSEKIENILGHTG